MTNVEAFAFGALSMSGFAAILAWSAMHWRRIAKDRSQRISHINNIHEVFSHGLVDRLNRIAAEEKPTSNATVRRMARIARGEE